MTESYAQLSFDGLIEIQNKTYFSSSCFNGLVEVDNKTNTVRIVKRFPKENIFMYLLHHKIIENGNEIIFTPDLARTIHIVDLLRMEISCIEFSQDDDYNARCVDSYVWDGKLWLFFSNRKTPITSMELSTHHIERYPQLTETLKKITKDDDSVIFWSVLWKEQGQIYGVLFNSQYIIHIDLVHRKTEYFYVAMEGKRFADIAVGGNIVYLTQFDSYEIVLYSLIDGSIEKCVPDCLSDPAEEKGYMYSNILLEQEEILLIPNHGNEILCLQNKNIMPFCHMPEGYRDIEEDGRITWRRFYSSESKDGLLRLFPARSNMLLEINVKEKKAEGRSYQMPPEWLNTGYYTGYVTTYISEAAQDGASMSENEVVNLKDYLRALQSIDI